MSASACPKTREEAKRGEDRRCGRPALLLVDDLPENLFALEALLRREDIDIVTARSGSEALERLLDQPIALAIIDVQMPEMDGFELASLMRGVHRTRHVPIIFVTAGARDQGRVFQGYEAGAVDFLFKPIEAHVLRSKVDVFITLERQRRELEASENRFRALVQSSSEAIWRMLPDGRGLADSWCAFTGQSEADWRAGRWLEMVHPDDRQRVGAAWEEARAAQASFAVDYRVRRPDGAYRWTHVWVAPVFDRQGNLLEWVGANADVEEGKEAERMRELFVAILGHDLRNPLSSMLVATQLALLRTTEAPVREALERVQGSGKRMVRMIDHFLDMSRLRRGGALALHPEETDLWELVDQVLLGAPAKRQRFQVEVFGDTSGRWDPERLFQVISNLVGNACEHGPGDSPIQVVIDGSREEEVWLRVRNFGAAIPQEVHRAIFEPFRGSEEGFRTTRGLGLGLYISKEFVEAHGGAISLRSSEEAGTLFEVRLPRFARTACAETRQD